MTPRTTLAARALSWADEVLPVFALPRAEDPHPLAHRPGGAMPAPRPAPTSVFAITLMLGGLIRFAEPLRRRWRQR